MDGCKSTSILKILVLNKKERKGRKMSIKKNKYSVSKVVSKKGQIIGYLSTRDEENGLDARLDMQGYTIVAL